MSNLAHHGDTRQRLAQAFDEGQRYWATDAGRAGWRCERACLGPILDRLTGQHALELGMAPTLVELAPVRHHLRWAPTREQASQLSTLVCDPGALALPDESMDIVLVHHLLEVIPEPHHALREAARVTQDHGRLLLVGWHPFGLGALHRCLPGRYKRGSYGGQWRSVRHLKDWLAFVDFEIERVDYCRFGMSGHGRLESWGRRHNLPLGSVFVINARRKMNRVHPIRLRFPVRSLVRGGAIGHGTSLARQHNRLNSDKLEKDRINAGE